MVAARLAVFSLGTDIGGSIRVPSAFNGVRGFKPTAGRPSGTGGMPVVFSTFNTIRSSCGPMGKSIEDLKEVLKIQYDP